jgi:hypothetical protein
MRVSNYQLEVKTKNKTLGNYECQITPQTNLRTFVEGMLSGIRMWHKSAWIEVWRDDCRVFLVE